MSYTRLYAVVLSVVAALGAGGDCVLAQACEPAWGAEGELPSLTDPLDDKRDVGRAWAVFDEGQGPVLFSGGLFTHAGDLVINGLGRWDGTAWSDVSGGVTGVDGVFALLVFDDGSGPALYVGGAFAYAGEVAADNLAKWDGQQWSRLGWGVRGGLPHSIVYALAAYDDGTGPALYAGGRFIESLNIPMRGVGKWNGTSWETTGSRMDEKVNALAVFDDGTGPALYAGGLFSEAGGVEAVGIAKYDGTSWSPVGGGVGGLYPHVRAFCVFDDGSGPALVVGGQFEIAGNIYAHKVAKWDGQNWSRLGEGTNAWITSLHVFDDGAGPALYAAGKFTRSGTTTVNYIAKWHPDTQLWTPLDVGMSSNIYGMGVFDDGGGPDLYVNGLFETAGGIPANSVAKWNGCLVLPGNLDADGDLDLADARRFTQCMTPPGGNVDIACRRGDVDGDGDADLGDFALMQSGPFRP